MNKPINFVVTDSNLVVAYRGNKKAYARPFGGDTFDAETGKTIAAKKLRIKELQSGIVETNQLIRAVERDMVDLAAFLIKITDRRDRMLDFKDTVTDELHDILNSLNG